MYMYSATSSLRNLLSIPLSFGLSGPQELTPKRHSSWFYLTNPFPFLPGMLYEVPNVSGMNRITVLSTSLSWLARPVRGGMCDFGRSK